MIGAWIFIKLEVRYLSQHCGLSADQTTFESGVDCHRGQIFYLCRKKRECCGGQNFPVSWLVEINL